MTRHASACLKALFVCFSLLCTTNLTAQITWWDKPFDEALVAAKDKPAKSVMLYCWQDNHDTCAAMFSGTMSDEGIGKQLGDYVCMGIKNDDAGREVWQRYRVQGVPTVIFVDPEGTVLDVLPGYSTIEQFGKDLTRVRDRKQTIPQLREQFENNPKDMAAALMLVQKVRLTGDNKGSQAVIDAMIKVDPKCKSEQAAEAMLWRINDETFADTIAPQDVDLTKLRRFLKTQRNKRIKFLGYDRMATAQYQKEDLKGAASSAMKAWKSIPEDRVVDWGQRIAGIAYRRWKEFDKTNKRMLKDALAISKKTLAAVEKRHKKQPDPTFYANAMYLHAAVLIVNKQRKDALALMTDAMKLDPKNENLKGAYKAWLAGDK